MYKIQLFGKEDEEILSISLNSILKKIESGNNFYWKIFWIEGISNPNFNMLELEKKAKKGFDITFDELFCLSDSILQLYEILLIGSLEPINDYDETNVYCYVFELIDSSYWEISSTDSVFITNIDNQFNS